jgi:hypothetical protein
MAPLVSTRSIYEGSANGQGKLKEKGAPYRELPRRLRRLPLGCELLRLVYLGWGHVLGN